MIVIALRRYKYLCNKLTQRNSLLSLYVVFFVVVLFFLVFEEEKYNKIAIKIIKWIKTSSHILPLGFFSLLFSGKTLICMSLIVIKAVV